MNRYVLGSSSESTRVLEGSRAVELNFAPQAPSSRLASQLASQPAASQLAKQPDSQPDSQLANQIGRDKIVRQE